MRLQTPPLAARRHFREQTGLRPDLDTIVSEVKP